jgi:large subunit ribosomal protein L4
MLLDVVNDQNQKVGALEVSDEVFGGRVNAAVIWETVVQLNASERRGTHCTKTRGEVSGTGRKPWRQKGTGRARAGEIRSPLWRKGGTVFGPRPRSYGYDMPKKVARQALRAALTQKMKEGAVTVVEQFTLSAAKTQRAAELLGRLGVAGKALIVDVKPGDLVMRSFRNLAGVRVVASGQLTARDVIDGGRLVATTAAVERLQQVLTS